MDTRMLLTRDLKEAANLTDEQTAVALAFLHAEGFLDYGVIEESYTEEVENG